MVLVRILLQGHHSLEGTFWFFSILTTKSNSQPPYGNRVGDKKQRKHMKNQNQKNKQKKQSKISIASHFWFWQPSFPSSKIHQFVRLQRQQRRHSVVHLPVPPTWESLVESDVPVSWGSTGRKLCGLTRRGKFGNSTVFPDYCFAHLVRVCFLDFAVAGLQEGQFGYQVQVQSFRRRCNLNSWNVFKLLVSDFGWIRNNTVF